MLLDIKREWMSVAETGERVDRKRGEKLRQQRGAMRQRDCLIISVKCVIVLSCRGLLMSNCSLKLTYNSDWNSPPPYPHTHKVTQLFSLSTLIQFEWFFKGVQEI